MEAKDFNEISANNIVNEVNGAIENKSNVNTEQSGSDNQIKNPNTSEFLDIVKKLGGPAIAEAPKNISVSKEISLDLDLDSNNLIKGLIMAEILGRPKGRKLRGNTVWNSRF